MHLVASYSFLLSLSLLLFSPAPSLPYLSAVLSACQGQTGLRRSVLIKTGCGDGREESDGVEVGGEEATLAGLRRGLVKRVMSNCWWSYLNSPPDSELLLYLSPIQGLYLPRCSEYASRLSCRLAEVTVLFHLSGMDTVWFADLRRFI